MRTKIVYVLVSQETDYYYEMLLLSLYSLRLHHPKGDAEVEVVMDEDTHQRLVEKKAEILNDVTPIVVPIPPEYTVMQRSRYLKTQLRQIVKGDFLFLDCDTLVCDALHDIDNFNGEVAMVHNCNNSSNVRLVDQLPRIKQAGFNTPEDAPYYNSGVIFARDTPAVSQLFVDWHRLWKLSLKKDVPYDQPALQRADCDNGYSIIELPNAWNYQLRIAINPFTQNTKVLHYIYSYKNNQTMSRVLSYIKQVGKIDNRIAPLASCPKSIGFTVCTIPDKRVIGFLISDLIYIYDTVPTLYKTISWMAKLLVAPIQYFYHIKQNLKKWMKIN